MPPAPRRTAFGLAALLLVLCTVLMLSRTPGRPDPAGFGLLAEDSSSKLNNTSAEAPDTPETPVPRSVVDNPSPNETSVPAPPEKDRREPSTLPPVDSPAVVGGAEVEDGYSIRNPHRGDTPMMQAWKILGWQSLLAAALAGTPAAAEDKPDPKEPSREPSKDSVAKPVDLEQLRTELANIRKAMEQKTEESEKNLKTQIELLAAQTTTATKELQGDINRLKMDASASAREIAQLRQELESLRAKELLALRQEIDSLRKRFYEPGQPPTAQPPLGRVQLINAYPDTMTVILNGRAYQLLPNETRMVSVPAGPFTYQVLRVHTDLQPRSLAANQTFTITVHPQ
jgi:hypothetical protein